MAGLTRLECGPRAPMRILFVYQNIYSMGGVQTWLARMLPRLQELGHEIEVLVRPRGRPWDTTDAFADALRKTGVMHVSGRNWFSAPSSYPASLGPVDVIFPCSLDDLLLGGLVQTHRSPEAKLVSGMFAPREYCWKAPRWQRHYVQRLGERWLREAPIANMVFIAESTVRQNSECIGRDLTGAPIVPLAIDTESV